tara:strand:- start:1791 stop:2699 length:909 start_codon:yes stop_codon:yes gene_type:complete
MTGTKIVVKRDYFDEHSFMKYAILSMDIEDWYHLDYFNQDDCDKNYSMLDGIDVFRQILSSYNIKGNFFVVGELARSYKNLINELILDCHDIGYHSWSHIRPLTLSTSDYYESLVNSKKDFENIIGKQVLGYRAPCFSMDRERLNIVKDVNFRFDSSLISFSKHSLYGNINMDGFDMISPNIYLMDEFIEFEVSTHNVFGKNIPVSGGGYLRIFPWQVMSQLVRQYLRENELYTMYIHPFELSRKNNPKFPKSTQWYNKIRFKYGRHNTIKKLDLLIKLILDEGYSIITFTELIKIISKNKT